MAKKGFLINQAKCTGCRGCQVACKSWNQNPATPTVNRGSFENPPDLDYNTFTRIAFYEFEEEGQLKWQFVKEQCQHCTEATCVYVCPTGAMHYTEFGTVAYDIDKCIGCRYCAETCPFEVPRYNPALQKVSKCDLCFSRMANGLVPACAKTCPPGAIQFGDIDELLAIAGKEIENAKKTRGKELTLYGADVLGGLQVLRLLEGPPERYGLPAKPRIPKNVVAWKGLFKPLIKYGLPITVGGIFLHYFLKGPHLVEEEGGE